MYHVWWILSVSNVNTRAFFLNPSLPSVWSRVVTLIVLHFFLKKTNRKMKRKREEKGRKKILYMVSDWLINRKKHCPATHCVKLDLVKKSSINIHITCIAEKTEVCRFDTCEHKRIQNFQSKYEKKLIVLKTFFLKKKLYISHRLTYLA